MKRQGAGRLLLGALGFAGLLAVGGLRIAQAADEPALVEKMLSPDSVAAIVVRNPDITSARWKETALFEVLQTAEMQEMLAPLQKSILGLYGALPPGITQMDFSGLFPCESALAAVVLPQPGGASPELMFQLILHPADPIKGQATIKALFDWFVESKIATRGAGPDGAEMLEFTGKFVILYSFEDGAMVLTLNDKSVPDFLKLHADTVARRTGAAGLSADPEYALGRSRIGPAPEAWLYFGLFPWLAKNAEIGPMAAPVLAMAGLERVQGCTLGTTIEDRGFRTRLFVHMTPPARPEQPMLIGPDQFALVPRDVVAFTIGSADWKGAYDKVTRLLTMSPPPVGTQVTMGISQVEAMLGMNIRDDVFGMFSGPYVIYATESDSPIGEGQNCFLKVSDSDAAAANLERLLNGVSRLIQQAAGPEGEGYVRIRRIDRPHITQVYPQSILPGSFTPTFVISDTGWAAVDLSARSALAKIRYFMDHKENVSLRQDFTKILAKMPQGYEHISYTDVGRCFGNGLVMAQMLTDLPVLCLKLAAKGDTSFKFPLPLNEFWGMDPGRFPPEALLREKLFGAVSVTVPQPDGWLYENFSPVGPIPLSGTESGMRGEAAAIPILAGLLLPALAKARDEAREHASMSNLNQILKAILAYQESNADNIPPSLADLFPNLLNEPKVLISQSDDAPMKIKNGMLCSYRYIGTVPFNDMGPGSMILYDHTPHANERAVGFFDGHVLRMPEPVFRQQLAIQYEEFKLLMAKPDFPGNRDRVKAFFEDKDFEEK
jgi:hypothetical protein